MPLPPRWVRRILFAPAVVLLAFFVVTTLPLWLFVAAAASPLVPGHLRPLRVLWIGTVYLVLDAFALVVMFGLWLASGFGWKKRSPPFQRAHYVLTGWFLRVLFWQARWTLRLRIDIVGTDPDTAAPGRPELVLSRHAGPGDSFILIHALVNWYAREPRIVLKDTLQWDPAVDVLLNRLPNRFIAPGPAAGSGKDSPAAGSGKDSPAAGSGKDSPAAGSGKDSPAAGSGKDSPAAGSGKDSPAAGSGRPGPNPGNQMEEQVGALATGLDHNDAFVIFPEGGNFTPGRRLRAIDRLRRLGLHAMAERAERMRHVLAPRPGGVLAALDAAPDAGVIFVAHAGLDHMLTIADVWRELPMDKRITMRWWSVQPEEIPTDRQQRIEWLYDWWARIDAWVEANRADPTPSG